MYFIINQLRVLIAFKGLVERETNNWNNEIKLRAFQIKMASDSISWPNWKIKMVKSQLRRIDLIRK